jgi:hypothetical protein
MGGKERESLLRTPSNITSNLLGKLNAVYNIITAADGVEIGFYGLDKETLCLAAD